MACFSECLLYYVLKKKIHSLKPRYYIDLINRKFKHDLIIDGNIEIINAKRENLYNYEINSDFTLRP